MISASGTYSFTIKNVTNPPSTRLYKVITEAIFTDSSGNRIMQLPTTKFVMLQTQFPANIFDSKIKPDKFDYATRVKYTITFKPTNPISGQGSIVLTWPS